MEKKKISDCAKLLKAMGNEKRLEILYYLYGGESCVGDLEKKVKLSQSALSQHLAVLREAGIVKTRRNAQTIFYSLKCNKAINILDLLQKMS